MAYKRQNFETGMVLKAEHMENIENALLSCETRIATLTDDVSNAIESPSSPAVGAFLRYVNGVWSAVVVPNAEEAEF